MSVSHFSYVSYRSDQRRYIQPFIDGLGTAINKVSSSMPEILKLQLKPVYTAPSRFDEHITEQSEKSIAKALCMSACMVLFYTPDYFSDSSRMCMREYSAMRMLEKQRNFSLIVPVIIKGSSFLPAEFETLPCFNFEKLSLFSGSVEKHPGFDKNIQKLSKYIIFRYQEILGIQYDCSRFILPKYDRVMQQKMKNLINSEGVPPSYSIFTSKAIAGRVKPLISAKS